MIIVDYDENGVRTVTAKGKGYRSPAPNYSMAGTALTTLLHGVILRLERAEGGDVVTGYLEPLSTPNERIARGLDPLHLPENGPVIDFITDDEWMTLVRAQRIADRVNQSLSRVGRA